MEVMSPGTLLRIDQEFARFSDNIVGDVILAIPEMNGVFPGPGRASEVIGHASNYGQGRGTDSSEGTLMYNSITGRDIRTHTEPYSRGYGAVAAVGRKLKLAIFIPS